MQCKVSELNRVLLVLKELMDINYSANINDVVDECKTVVIEGVMPDHSQTILFAEKLGFIKKETKKMYLLEPGKYLLDMNKEKIYDLTVKQKKYILRTCFLHGVFRENTLDLFDKFSPSYKDNTFRWSAIDDAPLDTEGWFAEWLVELGLLTRIENGLEVTNQYVDAVSSFLDEGKGWTIEAFEQYLKEKREIGDIAEKMVLAYESERLVNLRYEVEAKCIRIISSLRVNAGYDIESFDGSAPGINYNRFIEVKGSRNSFVRFFWTENEMAIAKKLGKKYWIYFQGGIDIKKGIVKNNPLMFQDPLNSIMKDVKFTKTPQGLIIEGKIKGNETSRIIE